MEVVCWGQRLDTVHQGSLVGKVATDAVLSSVVGADTCSMCSQVRVVEVLVVVLYKLRCLNPLGY